MFDVGFLEIVVILVLALIVLGPERLPKAARTVGYWVGKARRYIEGVKAEVEREFDSSELKRILHNQEVQIKELQSKVNEAKDSLNKDYRNILENDDDPGNGHNPQYEIIEEDDYQEPAKAVEDKNKQPADDTEIKPAEKAHE